ncbi:MAG: ribosome biogenesis GTPase YlqF [Lachnospiraceae bacterium]|nr:ribosome biogenesis GTPase YlqF [Lachnospiraceae bacterium]
MSIQWYPGHIAKATREIKEKINEVDVVIEIIDARCPLSSIDFLNDDIATKKRLIVVNKVDLVDKDELVKLVEKRLIKNIKSDKAEIIYLDSRDNNISKIVNKKIDLLCSDIYEKKAGKGITDYKVRAMVIGAPNVGKSTFINSYTKRKSNKVENTPGVTKKLQWTKVSDKVLLLDTPGITVKKFENDEVGNNLALIGSINDDILIKQDLVYDFIKRCYKRYSNFFIKRYKLDKVDEDSDALAVMDAIAKKNSFVKKSGDVDYERTSNLIINDFRKGKLGKIILEQ